MRTLEVNFYWRKLLGFKFWFWGIILVNSSCLVPDLGWPCFWPCLGIWVVFDARKTTGEKCHCGISRVLHFRFSFKHVFWVAPDEPVPKPSRNLKSGENFAINRERSFVAVTNYEYCCKTERRCWDVYSTSPREACQSRCSCLAKRCWMHIFASI